MKKQLAIVLSLLTLALGGCAVNARQGVLDANGAEQLKLILPVVEGHSVKRVYSLNGGIDDNENPIRQEQEKVFPAIQVRIIGPGRTAWGCGSSQAIGAS